MKKLTILTAILITSMSFAQVPNYVPTNGLVGWWPFNGNANDESGNGNNGTVNGATLTSDRNGIANKAYSFDGIDDYINILFSSSLHGQTGTINVWIKTNGIFTTQKSIFSQSSGRPQLVAESQGESGNQSTNSAAIQWKATNGLFPCAQSNSAVDISEWLMITANYSSDTFKIYINGINETITNTALTQDNCSQNNFQIGGFYQTNSNCGSSIGFSQMFDGFIDDICIWNRALTDCEIKNLYNGGVPNSSQTQSALDTYTWPVNNQTYTQSGTYADTLVNAAGCDSIVTLNLTLSFTGINELNTTNLTISPNPTAGDFTIAGLEFYNNISTMRITDVNGKLIKELDPTASKFTLGTVQPGVYFLTISAGNKQDVIKLIKE